MFLPLVLRHTLMAARVTGSLAAGLALAVAVGVAAGLGGYTFVYAKGASYLTNDPPPAPTAT